MPNLLARGVAFHSRLMKVAGGETITLHWRNKSVTVTGWPEQKKYQSIDENGFATLVEFWDWRFEAADLVFDDDQVQLPIKGYWLSRTLNGTEERFDVTPPQGMKTYDHPEGTKTQIIVHTVAVE